MLLLLISCSSPIFTALLGSARTVLTGVVSGENKAVGLCVTVTDDAGGGGASGVAGADFLTGVPVAESDFNFGTFEVK